MKDSEGLRGELQGRVAVALTCRAVALGKSSPLNLDVLICRRNNDAVAEVVSEDISPAPAHTPSGSQCVCVHIIFARVWATSAQSSRTSPGAQERRVGPVAPDWR